MDDNEISISVDALAELTDPIPAKQFKQIVRQRLNWHRNGTVPCDYLDGLTKAQLLGVELFIMSIRERVG